MYAPHYGVKVDQASISRVAKADPRGYMTADVIDSVVAPFGLRAQRFRRGGIDDVRQLISKGIPVIVLQWLRPGSSIPHFRVVTGFDDTSATMTVLDPLYGPQVSISYTQFTTLRQVYNSEFIPVYPLQWDAYVRHLLGV